MSLEILFILGGIALVLVALNFGLQRLVRPGNDNDAIAGCCGMALPNEITQTPAEPTRLETSDEKEENDGDPNPRSELRQLPEA